MDSEELFYLDSNGVKQDALLHEFILSEGDDAAALEVSLRIAREMGIGDPDVHRAWWRAREYDESEHPRDELGRWTDGGGGDGGAAEKPPKDKDGNDDHPAGHIERTVKSMQGFAKDSQGSLRERVVIMERATGKVLADIEQELMIGANVLEHVPKPGTGFTDADQFDAERNFHPDGSILHLHTHPIDQAFSDGDWRVFMRSTIGEMRVVAPNGEYTLVKTKEFTDKPWQERTPAAMNTAYNKHLDAVFEEYVKADKYDDINGMIEQTTVRVAKEFGIEYSFRPLVEERTLHRDHPGKGYSDGAFVKNGVIHTNDVNDAAKALGENRKVELNQPRQLSILLDKLGEIAKEMITKGEKAPHFNLCNVTLSGTSLFCVNAKGIPRVEMPQLAKSQDVEFFKYLEAQGYKVKYEQQYASYLHATQNELSGTKVAAIARLMRERDYGSNPIFVSNDDYILDGHHRWAAEVGNDAADNVLGNNKKMDIARVDISITKLLEEAEKFTEGKGKLAHGERRDQKQWAWALARWRAEQTLARLQQKEVEPGTMILGVRDIMAGLRAAEAAPPVCHIERPCQARDFDPSQPRDEEGQWSETGADGGTGSGGSIKDVADVELRKVKDKVFDGEPVPVDNKLNKQETGKVGEEVGLAYVRQIMGHDDARVHSLKAGEKAVDMIADHLLIEVKAGLVSNSKGAQQWRATEGQPGKAEREWRKTATAEEIAELGETRQQRIIERKEKLLKEKSEEMGRELQPATIASIINPDTKTADVYLFDGFHLRIGWRSELVQDGYVGTFKYS